MKVLRDLTSSGKKYNWDEVVLDLTHMQGIIFELSTEEVRFAPEVSHSFRWSRKGVG